MSQQFLSNQQNISNVSIGDSNVVTFNQTQILQISVAEIKTRQFIQTSPYKGLKKFEPEDKDLFFGRDQFLTGLVNELEQTNLILLLGASGSGKSSVIRAGLIPWLSQKWGSRLVNLMFTPDDDPFESLYASLLGKYKQAEAQIARQAKADTLTQVVTKLKQPDDYYLIFIDQLEELFTLSQPEKRDKFIASLVQLTKTKSNYIKIVATMRADFLDRLSPYPQLIEATDKHRPMIAEMQPDELRLAIEQPAAQHGVVLETGLVEEIINDIQGQAGYLPLLQYTLDLLWETEVETNSIQDRTLNISTYRGLGGVRGALQKHVDIIYDALSTAEKLAAERIFLKLVGVGEDDEFESGWKPVRRRANVCEFNDQIEKDLLAKLINENLLVSNSTGELSRDRQSPSSESTIEIAHEILLSSWTTLNTWIQENHQAIALRNRLNEDVTRWQAKKTADELWSGSKLEQVLELRKDPNFNQVLGGFSITANKFIDSSVEVRDRQRLRTIIGLSVFSTVALALAAFSTIQYQRAELGQITALEQTSAARFAVNRNTLDALMGGLDASKRLRSLFWGKTPEIQAQVQTSLAEAVYWTRELNRLQGHQYIVQNVSFSPDGKILATASYDKTVKLWRLDGSLITTLEGHKDAVMSVAFSSDSQTIASADRGGTVKLWQRDGNLIDSFKAHQNSVFSVAFIRDNQIIATASKDKTAKLWRVNGQVNRQPITTLTGHTKPVRQVLFSPNGHRIVTISSDTTLRFWENNGKPLPPFPGHSGTVMSADFSRDSQFLATASLDKTVKIWNQEGKVIKTLNHPQEVWSVSFSSDGQTLATGSADGTVRLWRRDGTLLDTWAGHEGQIPSLDFSPDGQILATASNDKFTKLWRVNRDRLTVLVGHQDSVSSAKFSRNNQQVASVGQDGTLRLWSLQGKLLSTQKIDQDGVYDVNFSPDGRSLATANENNTITIWSPGEKTLKTFSGHKNSVNMVSFSPDGTLASASDDGTVKLWHFNGKEPLTLKADNGRVLSVNFSPNGKIIASGGDDQTVKLWTSDGQPIKSAIKHDGTIWNVNFSQDGKTIVTASSDRTAKLWTLEGKAIATLKGHTATVLDASISPNGEIIATASSDRTIKLWRRDGSLIMTLIGHQSDVNRVSFSEDGKSLISAGKDGIVLLWNVSNLSLQGLRQQGCKQIRDYLQTHPSVSPNLCN
ncbi:WD-40 repeat protein [Calothrix sp. NIES-2100]|uniref:WD40 repeat domain-containing protein n=1 Tax=Calothrix sp. NIES-2100 TaxID=1954172 RepID=UPI000B5EB21D|nr:WD-40 repeat protein [Calothrix sp. NIES-2100]